MSAASEPEPLMDGFEEVPEVYPPPGLIWPVRVVLVGIALLIAAVLTVGACLHPYDENGQPKRQETHRQLGLPACSFYRMTKLPCPSCGFTTSFSLVMHLDPINALRANCVGTLLALFCICVVPWAIVSAWRGRYLLVESGEHTLIVCLIAFVVLMLTRWAIILTIALTTNR
jgi:hypothetical protein